MEQAEIIIEAKNIPEDLAEYFEEIDNWKPDVWTITTKSSGYPHFSSYPEDLIEPCILAGCPAGGIVLDPFCGTGTTNIVALKLGCSAIGIDLQPDYISIAGKRRAKLLRELSRKV